MTSNNVISMSLRHHIDVDTVLFEVIHVPDRKAMPTLPGNFFEMTHVNWCCVLLAFSNIQCTPYTMEIYFY